MVGTNWDITDQNLSERQLKESEERYRTTFDHAPVGILTSSLEGSVLQCNARLCQIIGYAPEEMAGLTIEQLTFPEDREKSQAMVDRLIAGEIRRSMLTWRQVTSTA